jgi:hypothetical protein
MERHQNFSGINIAINKYTNNASAKRPPIRYEICTTASPLETLTHSNEQNRGSEQQSRKTEINDIHNGCS